MQFKSNATLFLFVLSTRDVMIGAIQSVCVNINMRINVSISPLFPIACDDHGPRSRASPFMPNPSTVPGKAIYWVYIL